MATALNYQQVIQDQHDRMSRQREARMRNAAIISGLMQRMFDDLGKGIDPHPDDEAAALRACSDFFGGLDDCLTMADEIEEENRPLTKQEWLENEREDIAKGLRA